MPTGIGVGRLDLPNCPPEKAARTEAMYRKVHPSGRLRTGNGEQLKLGTVPFGVLMRGAAQVAATECREPWRDPKGNTKSKVTATPQAVANPSDSLRRWAKRIAPAPSGARAAEVDALVSTPLRLEVSGFAIRTQIRADAPFLREGAETSTASTPKRESGRIARVAKTTRCLYTVRPPKGGQARLQASH